MAEHNGKGRVCYIEVPALNVAASAEFYQRLFGWNIRQRGDGSTAFDDPGGCVSGAFVLGRPPMDSVGLLIYIMVDDIAAAISAVETAGGRIVQPLGADAPELTARFADPGGNIFGLYQEPVQPG